MYCDEIKNIVVVHSLLVWICISKELGELFAFACVRFTFRQSNADINIGLKYEPLTFSAAKHVFFFFRKLFFATPCITKSNGSEKAKPGNVPQDHSSAGKWMLYQV